MPTAEAGSLYDLAQRGHLDRAVAREVVGSVERVPNRRQVRRTLRDRLVMPRAEGLTVYGEGVDFSSVPNFGCVRASGRNFVCMYVKWTGRGTVEAARAAGLRVIPIYETTGVDYRGSYGAGVAAARAFDAWCNANGYPGAVGYMTYDTDVLGVGQYGLAAAYADGWRDTLGRGRVGGYGQNGLVTRLYAEGHIGWVWVTYAWSGGALGPEPVHIYQNPNDIQCCGVDCDRDRSFTPTMGAIGEGTGPGPAPAPPPDPNKEDEQMGAVQQYVPSGGFNGRPVFVAWPIGTPLKKKAYEFSIDSLDDPNYVQMARLAMGSRAKGVWRPPLQPAGGWGPYDCGIGASSIGWVADVNVDDGVSVLPYAFPNRPNVGVTVTLSWELA